MTKYEPLTKYLVNKGYDEIPLTFSEIESAIEDKLPASARKYRAWWSNNAGNSVMTHAWIAAGYRSARVNLEGERVVFLKEVGDGAGEPEALHKTTLGNELFGCMAGTVTVSVQVDLAAPVGADWQEVEV